MKPLPDAEAFKLRNKQGPGQDQVEEYWWSSRSPASGVRKTPAPCHPMRGAKGPELLDR